MNTRRIRVFKSSTLTSGIDRLNVFLPLRYPVWCSKKRGKPIMSIDLVIDRDRGKGAFRSSININEN